MTICGASKTETWSPDFSSSGQPNPSWTRVRFGGGILVNTLEWANWVENPVQLIVCDACGTEDCASGGYVHVSRLADFVLLTAPQVSLDDDWSKTQYAPLIALESLGAIAIPDSTWANWRAAVPGMPDSSIFPPATGRALAEAWALGPGRPKNVERLPALLHHRLVGCDTLTPESAICRVEHWLNQFLSRAGIPLKASVVTPAELGVTLETLYFDGPGSEDWLALALGTETDYIVLDNEHVLVLAESWAKTRA